MSSGFGRELVTQLLGRGDTVVGTIRHLVQKYPDDQQRPHTCYPPVTPSVRLLCALGAHS